MVLKGMTWSHPRGYEPLVACSAAWRERTGVDVVWDRRSLQDFESYPVDELAARYDLVVIDHPHVGQITAEGCLLPLDGLGRDAELAAIAAGSVGPSFASYEWEGRQWALPIDAATQVQAWRPDRLPAPPTTWAEVVELARTGAVLVPLKPPHSLLGLCSLVANRGAPAGVRRGSSFLDPAAGAAAYALLSSVLAQAGPDGFAMDPIDAYEALSARASPLACVPLAYGYVSYAMAGFRAVRLAFADMPAVTGRGPVGSALGGTGLAVSARSATPDAAADFAFWVAGGATQRTLYAVAGGQAGHADAWSDPAVNGAAGAFYAATRATLNGAWVRPRHDGYMPFQHAASVRLNEGLRSAEPADAVIAELNGLFARSFGP